MVWDLSSPICTVVAFSLLMRQCLGRVRTTHVFKVYKEDKKRPPKEAALYNHHITFPLSDIDEACRLGLRFLFFGHLNREDSILIRGIDLIAVYGIFWKPEASAE